MTIYILHVWEADYGSHLQVLLTYDELKQAYKKELDKYLVERYDSVEAYEDITGYSYTDCFDILHFQDDNFYIETMMPCIPDDRVRDILNGSSGLQDNGLDIKEDEQDELLQ